MAYKRKYLRRLKICGLTLVPWIIFRTPSGKPASIANSARIIEAPKKEKKMKIRRTEKLINSKWK